MKRCLLIFITAFAFVFSQEPLQNQFSFRITPEAFLPPLESWLFEPQDDASMWYADIPDNVRFSMQFVEIPKDVEFFIYPEPVQDLEFEFVLPKQKP